MSDPLFLRNMISNSVYAEQMNSAQIQGQAAARERAARARQEAIKAEQAQIAGLEEATKPGVNERESRNGQASDQDADERSEESAEDREDSLTQTQGSSRHRIDLTV